MKSKCSNVEKIQPSFRLKVRKNGEQKTCNLSCNIAAKRVEERCCAFYQTHQTCLATNRFSTRFVAMLQNKLHVFVARFVEA